MSAIVRGWAIPLLIGGLLDAGPGAQLAVAQGHTASHAVRDSIPRALLERQPAPATGIGTAHDTIHTTSREAQSWYDIGLAHLHSFSWIEAAQAFNAALRSDPALAIAHVGLSFAYGGLGSLEGARDAANRARSLAASADAHDRQHIELRLQQLQVLAGALAPERYATALDQALQSRPHDVELLLLRGEATSATAGSGRDSGAAAVTFFRRAQQASPQAFAPRHYLAHAYENSDQIELALQESQSYVAMAPAVPHAHHMLAHSLRRVGRTDEAIAAFERAAALATAHARTSGIPGEYDWHSHHNTALLAATYRYVGRWRDAERLLRSAFSLAAPLLPEELSKRELPALLLALGRPREALAAAASLIRHRDPMVRAAGHLAAAQAHLATAQATLAGAEADAALVELRAAGPDASVLAPDLRLIQGVFLLQGGERARAQSMIRDAVASWRARTGPDAWSDTLFAIESALRLVRPTGDAPLIGALTDALAQHDPRYAGTALALARAAEDRGDAAAARAAYADAVARWQHADTDLPDLVFARTRAAAAR